MAKAPAPFDFKNGLSLNKLHLDSSNPRFDPIRNEAEIVAQLFKAEAVMGLAKDIAQKGGVSPLDRFGVIEMDDMPGHYIVTEGNRRLCALKALQDPRKSPTPANRKKLESYARNSVIPTAVDVVIFRDRETARPWLGLRHLGEQSGAGTRKWKSQAKARYSRGDTPDHLAFEILERAEAAGWIDTPTRKRIKLTTLTRYLGTPSVRVALGLGDRAKLSFTHTAPEVDKALKQFVLDSLPGADGKAALLSSRSSAKQRESYASELKTRGLRPKTAATSPTPPPPAGGPAGKKPKAPQHPDDRLYVMPPEFVAMVPDKTLQRLQGELRNLKPVDDFKFSTNYLVRAVIERILYLFAKDRKVFYPGMTDSKLVIVCHEQLAKDGIHANALKNMRLAGSEKDVPFSLDTLGSAVHGTNLPTRQSLIHVWDNWEPSLKLMLERL